LYNAASGLTTFKWFQHELCIVPVENYRAKLPNGIQMLEFVMYKQFSPSHYHQQIKTLTSECADCGTDSEHTVIVTKNLVKDFMSCKSCLNGWDFLEMSHSVLSNIPSRFKTCADSPSLCKCSNSFTMDYQNALIRTTFESGSVLIAYRTVAKDDEGNMLIPNVTEVKDALMTYMKMKYWEVEDFKGTQGAFNRLQTYKKEWEHTAANAKMRQIMPLEEGYIKIAKSNRLFHNDSPYNVFLDNGRMQTMYT
jgi:hypothetical protein